MLPPYKSCVDISYIDLVISTWLSLITSKSRTHPPLASASWEGYSSPWGVARINPHILVFPWPYSVFFPEFPDSYSQTKQITLQINASSFNSAERKFPGWGEESIWVSSCAKNLLGGRHKVEKSNLFKVHVLKTASQEAFARDRCNTGCHPRETEEREGKGWLPFLLSPIFSNHLFVFRLGKAGRKAELWWAVRTGQSML